MSKMTIVVFDDEEAAYKGSDALRSLHLDGVLTVYAAAVVARDAAGQVDIKDAADKGPLGTALGMLTGAMVGLLAGPAGVVAGTAVGGLVGATADLYNVGVSVDFLNEVTGTLEPGKVAIVAEIGETWVTPLDTRMSELGATVIRRNRVDVEGEQFEREVALAKAEYEDLKAELSEAAGDAKANLQAKVDTAKAKLEERGRQAKQKLDETNEEINAKVAAIEGQLQSAKDEAKANLEKRKAELRARHAVRSEKLSQAWELTKEAIAA